MGFFGALKSGIKKVGKFAQKAAPALAFIPGVGTLAAAGIGAAGGLIGGNGLRGAAKGAIGGAAGGLAQAGLSRLGGGANPLAKWASGRGGGSALSSGIKGVGGGGGGGGIGGAIRGVGSFIKDNPQLALGGLGALQNAHQQSRFEGQQGEALDAARQQMQGQQQFRDMLMQRFANQPQTDFSQTGNQVFQDKGNPFFRGA